MRLTIGKKVFGAFTIVLVLLIYVGAIGFYQVNNVDKEYTTLLDNEVEKLQLLKDVTYEIQKAQTYANNYLLRSNTLAYYHSFNASIETYRSLYEQLLEYDFDEDALEKVMLINEFVDTYTESAEEMFRLNRSAARPSDIDAANNAATSAVTSIANTSEEIITMSEANMAEVREDTERSVANARTLLLIVVITTVIVGGFGAFYIGRTISTPVIRIASASQRMAAGNLAIEEIKVKNNDEIGDMAEAFNQMVVNIRGLIHQVSLNSEQVSAAAEQLNASAEQTTSASEHIAENIQHVSSVTEQQAQSADQTSQGINEMTTSIQLIAQNTSAVHTTSVEAAEKAAVGNETTQTAVQQMNSVHSSIGELGNVIKQLGEQSAQIDQFIEVISNIASQTNLLALNAAIEASRAGEEGRGFAVVASEVRKLAEQTAESAEEITQLIQSVQEGTEKAVLTAGKTTEEVAEGLELVGSAGRAFDEIRNAIEEVSGRIGDVSASVQEISATTEQMNQSVTRIAELGAESARNAHNVSAATEEQLASMEEINASAQSLSSMAEDLQLIVNKFKV